jgi:hypothetical protein
MNPKMRLTFAVSMNKIPKLEPFANRLAKMHKHFGKWARRRALPVTGPMTTTYPAPLAIDIYENIARAEYARDHGMEPRNTRPGSTAVSVISGVGFTRIDLPEIRQRQKGFVNTGFPCRLGVYRPKRPSFFDQTC